MRSWGVLFFLFFFFYCCLWRQGNGVTLLTQVHIPTQSLKWRLREREKKKRNGSVFNLMANLTLLSGFDGSETVHPPSFSSRGLGWVFFFFLILIVVINISNVLVMLFNQTHFLCVRFSSETYYLLVLHWVSLDISKQFRGSRPSPAHQSTALLLAVHSWAVDLWK